MEKNNKKIINAWCMYDWANSVYSLVITSTVFPGYYEAVTNSGGTDKVSFFGIEVVNTVLLSFSISLSFLIIVVLAPLLSGIADYGGKRKLFMKFFAGLGSLACIGLFFFEASTLEIGIICSMLASIGYAGSLVFYNAYLPEIATPDRYDNVSAKGFSLGYIGSVLLLLVNLVMIQKPQLFGISTETLAVRLSFVLVGLWWMIFALYSFYFLPKGNYYTDKPENLLTRGYQEIVKVLKIIKTETQLKKFLLSFFFFNTGVQTVMYMAASYGSKEIGLSLSQLIPAILIIQLVAIIGAHLFARVSKSYGNKFSLFVMIIIWIIICVIAYFVNSANEFYALAFVVGMVMGGIQALSRATYSKLIPQNGRDNTSFFSFYDATFNLSIVFGTLCYGMIEAITGSMRNSTIVLTIFFIIGLLFLLSVKVKLKDSVEV
jgi:MFS transporter, UMF1 family